MLKNDIKTCFAKVFVDKMSRALRFFSCSRVRVVNDFYGGREMPPTKEVVWLVTKNIVADGSGCARSKGPEVWRKERDQRVPEIQKRAGSAM